MNFDQTPEFAKELKAFAKKYWSLASDLEKFKVLISSSEQLEQLHFFEGSTATKPSVGDGYEVVKARLDCASLGNKQMLRIVYIHKAETRSALFVELYAKNVKDREDDKRIKSYLDL